MFCQTFQSPFCSTLQNSVCVKNQRLLLPIILSFLITFCLGLAALLLHIGMNMSGQPDAGWRPVNLRNAIFSKSNSSSEMHWSRYFTKSGRAVFCIKANIEIFLHESLSVSSFFFFIQKTAPSFQKSNVERHESAINFCFHSLFNQLQKNCFSSNEEQFDGLLLDWYGNHGIIEKIDRKLTAINN